LKLSRKICIGEVITVPCGLLTFGLTGARVAMLPRLSDVQFLLELSTSDIALYHFMGKIISKYDGHGARKCRRVSYVSRADYKMDLHTA